MGLSAIKQTTYGFSFAANAVNTHLQKKKIIEFLKSVIPKQILVTHLALSNSMLNTRVFWMIVAPTVPSLPIKIFHLNHRV